MLNDQSCQCAIRQHPFISNWSKLEAFVDDIINAVQEWKFTTRNSCGENAGHQMTL